MTHFLLFLLSSLLFLLYVSPVYTSVSITLNVNVVNPKLKSIKENYTDSWNLMYVGLYSLGDTKVQAMKYAIQYVNNNADILSNVKLELYGCNSKADRADTTSAVLAGYAGYDIQGFIGAESFDDTSVLQYIAGAYYVPQINPTVVEQALSSPTNFRSLFSIIPPSSDQQIAVLAVLKSLGIQTAIIINTNNEYGSEFNDMAYNLESIRLNMTFYTVTIDSSGSDFDQKLSIIKSQIPYYRYVIMHCTSSAGLSFLKILGDNGLINSDYLYIMTHQMATAVQEKSSNAGYIPYFNGAITVSARYNSDSQFSSDIRTSFAQASLTDFPSAGTDIKSAWFAFDAVYTYAVALDSLIKSGKTTSTISGEDYYNELLKTNLIGATGNISVNTTAARREGKWDIFNFEAKNASSTSNGTVSAVLKAITTGYSSDFETILGNFTFFAGRTTVPPPYVAPAEPLKIRSFNSNLSSALGAIVGVATLMALFAAAMLFMYYTAFARHGSFYSGVIIAGVFISYVSALVILPEPTDSLCVAFPWFLGVGFTFVYGCLFIKTWTLYKVWLDAEKFKKTQLTPRTIMKAIGVAVLFEVVILIIWTVIDPPKAVLHEMVDGYYMLQCRTEHITFWAIFVSIKGAWLIFGAVLSVLTRRIMREFNHSTSIAYAIYNIFALLVIGVPLAITLEDIPGGQIIIEVAVIVIAFTFTLVSLFFNVWYRIFVPLDDNIVSMASGGGSGSSTYSGGMRSQNRSFSPSHSRSHSGKSSSSGKESAVSKDVELESASSPVASPAALEN